MNKKTIEGAKKANMLAMDVLSDIRSHQEALNILHNNTESVQHLIMSASVDRAIDAVYMQNKLIDTIESIQSKDCFVTDNKGVVAILETLLIGSNKAIR